MNIKDTFIYYLRTNVADETFEGMFDAMIKDIDTKDMITGVLRSDLLNMETDRDYWKSMTVESRETSERLRREHKQAIFVKNTLWDTLRGDCNSKDKEIKHLNTIVSQQYDYRQEEREQRDTAEKYQAIAQKEVVILREKLEEVQHGAGESRDAAVLQIKDLEKRLTATDDTNATLYGINEALRKQSDTAENYLAISEKQVVNLRRKLNEAHEREVTATDTNLLLEDINKSLREELESAKSDMSELATSNLALKTNTKLLDVIITNLEYKLAHTINANIDLQTDLENAQAD